MDDSQIIIVVIWAEGKVALPSPMTSASITLKLKSP